MPAKTRFIKRWRRVSVFGLKTKVTQAIVEVSNSKRTSRFVLDVWRASRRDQLERSGGGPGRFSSKYIYQVRATLPLLGGVAGRVVTEGATSTIDVAKRDALHMAKTDFNMGY